MIATAALHTRETAAAAGLALKFISREIRPGGRGGGRYVIGSEVVRADGSRWVVIEEVYAPRDEDNQRFVAKSIATLCPAR